MASLNAASTTSFCELRCISSMMIPYHLGASASEIRQTSAVGLLTAPANPSLCSHQSCCLLALFAVWDNMRFLARKRFEEGIMPAWFKPEWLDIEEAPTNTWWRQQGLSAYRQDTSWLGENAPSTSSSGGDSSGGGPGMSCGQQQLKLNR